MRHFGVPSAFITGSPGSDNAWVNCAIPENLLRDMSLPRRRAGLKEVHAGRFRRRVFLEPFDELGAGIDGGRAIGVAAAAQRSADRDAVLRPNAPFVHGPAVRQAAITAAGHR